MIDLLVQALAFERAGVRGLDEFWEASPERDFGLEGVGRRGVEEALRQLVKGALARSK